jgi:protein translocase subunit secA
MGPIYRFLGLTVGYITSGMDNEERKKAYLATLPTAQTQSLGLTIFGTT